MAVYEPSGDKEISGALGGDIGSVGVNSTEDCARDGALGDGEGRETDATDHSSKSGRKAGGAALVALGLKFITYAKLLLPAWKPAVLMVVSLLVYVAIFGFWFALGFVVLLYVHELGHLYALRKAGLRASAPMFIPFVGAFIRMRDLPPGAEVEAWVGIAGPIAGLAGTLVVTALWLGTGNQTLHAISYVGYFLNGFNLIPISPLDGGRVVSALNPKIWYAGLLLLGGLLLFKFSFLLLFIALVGGYDCWHRLKSQRAGVDLLYYHVSPQARLRLACAYSATLLVAGGGIALTLFTPHH